MQFSELISVVQELDDALRRRAAQAVNVALTARNWLVGAWIVEFEQNGEDRARYGDRLIQEISQAASVKGLSVSNLRSCRQFYASYPRIGQALSDQFGTDLGVDVTLMSAGKRIHQTVSGESGYPSELISGSGLSDTELADPVQLLTQLSFSQTLELLRVDDQLKRSFYEIEAIRIADRLGRAGRRVAGVSWSDGVWLFAAERFANQMGWGESGKLVVEVAARGR